MNNISQTIKKLLFISDQICEIYDTLFDLSIKNQEKSIEYDNAIEFFENFLSQESILLDSLSQTDLIVILKNLYKVDNYDDAMDRCYESVKYYYLDKYPDDKDVIEEIEFADVDDIDSIGEENSEEVDEDIDLEENPNYFEIDYEDESEVSHYINYVNLKIKISVIKKMYNHIKNTETDNKIDHKYKKEMLKQFKGFKYDFFSLNRATELLGVKYHFDVNKVPEMPPINENISTICYNECLDILDDLYLMPSNEREIYAILETLFNMLCFDEYIKELSHEQIDRLIEVCHQLENNITISFFGNIGLQKLVRIKKLGK